MIKFSKYHGSGNDFIIMNEEDVIKFGKNLPKLVAQMCSRSTGIGADGVLVVRRSPLEMIVFNSDGSRAPMCGNGILCFANYCFDDDIIPLNMRDYNVKTTIGTMKINVITADPFVAEVNLGMPDFNPEKVGCDCESEELVNRTIRVAGDVVRVSTVFMGSIHSIVWVDERPWLPDAEKGYIVNEKIIKQGKEIAENQVFSQKTNVNFVRIINNGTVELITYERGSGFTASCATGAAASVVLGALQRKLYKSASVRFPYGQIEVSLTKDGVKMIGSAERIAQGRYYEK